jgi:hypothetical protein
MPALAYYISAHGYGHGVRSADIIRAFADRCPDVPIVVVSDLPQAFLLNRLAGARVIYRPGSFDLGMVQVDSIQVDVDATLARVSALCGRWDALVGEEARFLEANQVGLVVADIPAIPLAAAASAGLPRLAVGNFGWDWIYEAYRARNPSWAPVIAAFERGYSCADLLLRLPFHEEMTAFPKIQDIPLVGGPGRERREEMAALTGSDSQKTWVLLSFTTLAWDNEALAAVEKTAGCEFFTVLPLAWDVRNIHAVDRERMPFRDILASVDAVISKPGYGILADCIVNRKPLIFAERSDFSEYAILEDGIRRYLRNVHIPAAMLYSGNLLSGLDRLREAPEPRFSMPCGGEVVAARRIAELGPWERDTDEVPAHSNLPGGP